MRLQELVVGRIGVVVVRYALGADAANWGHAEISLWIAPRQIDLLQKHSRLQTVHFCIRLRGRVSSGVFIEAQR
jgi:hypothetical protein